MINEIQLNTQIVETRAKSKPKMFPILVHCGQAVLASNVLGSFKDGSWLTTGTPKRSFFGVGLTPRRRLNSATCNIQKSLKKKD